MPWYPHCNARLRSLRKYIEEALTSYEGGALNELVLGGVSLRDECLTRVRFLHTSVHLPKCPMPLPPEVIDIRASPSLNLDSASSPAASEMSVFAIGDWGPDTFRKAMLYKTKEPPFSLLRQMKLPSTSQWLEYHILAQVRK